jgi:hypothetical protein
MEEYLRRRSGLGMGAEDQEGRAKRKENNGQKAKGAREYQPKHIPWCKNGIPPVRDAVHFATPGDKGGSR